MENLQAMRWMRALLAGLTCAVLAAPLATGAAAAPCSKLLADGEWSEIPGPSYPKGSATMRGFAVDPRRPNILWAHNEKVLMVSRNGGCDWQQAFGFELLPSLEVPISDVTATIDSVVVPEAPGAGDTIFLGIEEKVSASVGGQTVTGPTLRAHVLRSDDGGKSWAAVDSGLPAVSGQILRLRAAPSDPKSLYLLLAGDRASGTQLYGSENGGTSWTQRSQGTTTDFVVDPIVPDELWLTGPDLYHSQDGGNTQTKVPYVSGPAQPADVFRAPGEPSRVMVYEVEAGFMSITEDGGRVWSSISLPPQVLISIAHGASADDVIISTHLGMYRYQSPGNWIEITPGVMGGNRPEDYEDVLSLQVDRTEAPAAWGYRPIANTILRYDRFRISLPPLTPTVPEGKAPASLTPAKRKVKLEPGASKTISYKLSLPPAPTPLDVFFLVDTTVSMDSAIQGLLEGIHQIANELTEQKVDVQFGVGEYKDYPIPGFGDPVAGDFPYRLNRAIGPADDSLVAAIERMEASGGGRGHFPESQLTGLYQSATGAGEPGFVSPGQQAGFRPGSAKVIVNITDAAFDDSAAHPSPPFDTVATELRGQGIMQVGLAARGESPVEAARQDLVRMAEATETFMPPGVSNCYLNNVQVQQGDPLVCDVVEDVRGVAQLGPALSAILGSLAKYSTVGLDAVRGADRVEVITPEVLDTVEVSEPSTHTFDVTLKCPRLSESSRTQLEFVATVADRGVAKAEALLVCSPLVKVKGEQIPLPPPPIIEQPNVAIVPPVAPAPPAPVSNANPQPNPNPQAAAAQQQQEEPQLAMATTMEDLEEDELLAFSAYERPAPALVPLLAAASAMTAAASALAIRTRNAARSAWNRR